MPRGHSEAVVTKFLRHALAAHALGVTELEISRRKVPADRVCRSQWRWQMPQQQRNESVDTRLEPAPARPIPADWVEG
jgi:hypothetical protein